MMNIFVEKGEMDGKSRDFCIKTLYFSILYRLNEKL